jgi:hypothetical protein
LSKIDVDYSGKPNKSLVRSRIFHLIDEKLKPEHKHSEELSFITFSGYRFVDSIEYYSRFNIRNIYSIENKERRYKRAVFNRPYEFIQITSGDVKDFIDEKYEDVIHTRKVMYLDYESMLRDNIIADVKALFSSGFFDKEALLFITFNRSFNRNSLTTTVREIVPEEIKSKEAYDTWLATSFSDIVLHEVCRKYNQRKVLKEVLKVFYQDTAASPMIVLGYYIRDRRTEEDLFTKVESEIFNLPVLTFLEANYIRNHLGKPSVETADRLGLLEQDVENYKNYA